MPSYIWETALQEKISLAGSPKIDHTVFRNVPKHWTSSAVTRRFAVDAADTFTHNVEQAMQQKNVVTALAFDVKGASDNVSKVKLINGSGTKLFHGGSCPYKKKQR